MYKGIQSTLALGIAISCGCLALTSCGRNGSTQTSSSTGGQVVWVVQFNVTDDENAPSAIATGELRLPDSWADSETFEGHWKLFGTEVGNVTHALKPDYLGPITGDGNFLAVRRDSQLMIDMHPGVIDNNVELQLTLADSTVVSGRWNYITDAGITASGTVQVR